MVLGRGCSRSATSSLCPGKAAPNAHFDTILNHKSLQPPRHIQMGGQDFNFSLSKRPTDPHPTCSRSWGGSPRAQHCNRTPPARAESRVGRRVARRQLGEKPFSSGIALHLSQPSEDGQCHSPPQTCSSDASVTLLLQNPVSWCLHHSPFMPST